MNAFYCLVLLGLATFATAQIHIPLTRTIGHPIMGGYGAIDTIYNRHWPMSNYFGNRWNIYGTGLTSDLYDCDCTKCCGCNNIYGGVFRDCCGLGTFGKCNCNCCKHCTTYGLNQLDSYNCQCCGLPIGKCNCRDCTTFGSYGGLTGTYAPYNLWNPLFRTFYGHF